MNEYTSEDAQRDFQRGLNLATPPEPPATVTMPHPAKPCINIEVPPADVPEIRRALAQRDQEAREHTGRMDEEAEKREAANEGRAFEATIHTDGGTRTMNANQLEEFARERFASLFA